MKKVLKTLALVATLIGFASCGSNPAAKLTDGSTQYIDPDIVIPGGGK